jgi:hypothetical protein
MSPNPAPSPSSASVLLFSQQHVAASRSDSYQAQWRHLRVPFFIAHLHALEVGYQSFAVIDVQTTSTRKGPIAASRPPTGAIDQKLSVAKMNCQSGTAVLRSLVADQ